MAESNCWDPEPRLVMLTGNTALSDERLKKLFHIHRRPVEISSALLKELAGLMIENMGYELGCAEACTACLDA